MCAVPSVLRVSSSSANANPRPTAPTLSGMSHTFCAVIILISPAPVPTLRAAFPSRTRAAPQLFQAPPSWAMHLVGHFSASHLAVQFRSCKRGRVGGVGRERPITAAIARSAGQPAQLKKALPEKEQHGPPPTFELSLRF